MMKTPTRTPKIRIKIPGVGALLQMMLKKLKKTRSNQKKMVKRQTKIVILQKK